MAEDRCETCNQKVERPDPRNADEACERMAEDMNKGPLVQLKPWHLRYFEFRTVDGKTQVRLKEGAEKTRKRKKDDKKKVKKPKAFTPKTENWNRLITDGLLVGEESNTKFPFKTMSKKFGVAWMAYCQAAWEANDDCLSEEEFCKLNGEIPDGFFKHKIRGS